MARPKRTDQPTLGRPDDILSNVPSIEFMEQRLTELELEAARVRTLLAAVRQMSGSRQPIQNVPGLVELDETA